MKKVYAHYWIESEIHLRYFDEIRNSSVNEWHCYGKD